MEPVKVEAGLSFDKIAAGGYHTCGISDGFAHCWGEGQYGQLGNGSYSDRGVPDMVAGGHAFDQISSGNQHTCGITVGGQAYCWGSGSYGRLGSGSNDITNIPVLVSSPLEP